MNLFSANPVYIINNIWLLVCWQGIREKLSCVADMVWHARGGLEVFIVQAGMFFEHFLSRNEFFVFI